LVRRTGADLLLPTQQRVRFAFKAIAEGDRIPVGSARLTAMHTPGHTSESTSYVLNETAVFTGDTLFTKGVGRPDLHADPEAARQRASALFVSLGRLRNLQPEMVVLPAHASEPIAFDGRAVAAKVSEIATWLSKWLASEAAFVDRVTSQLPPTPPNFVRIVDLNEAGEFPTTDPTDLEAGANRCAIS
jgi:glyoxylase-like metal-dependent hydrolase (beta-lactamase superfamily II)